MPTMFACSACGAKDAIALPLDESTEVVCPACKRRQPRRDYEFMRIQADLARGLARAAARKKDAITPGPEPTVCPSCGDDLWTEEHGCPSCGHGRKRLLARQSGLLPFAVSFAVAVLGAAGAVAVGVGQRSGPWMNIFLVAMSMVFSGVGVRALQRPTSLSIAPVVGHDAWGKTEYGPSRQATRKEGTTTGAIFLVASAGFLLLGVFLGKLTG